MENEQEKMGHDDWKCWRCKAERMAIREARTQLFGGYVCFLCGDCENDWDVYITAQAEYRRIHQLGDMIQIAFLKTASDHTLAEEVQARVNELRGEQHALNRTLFAMGEAWVSSVIERPKPEPLPPPTPEEIDEMRKNRLERLRRQLRYMEAAEAAIEKVKSEEERNGDNQAHAGL